MKKAISSEELYNYIKTKYQSKKEIIESLKNSIHEKYKTVNFEENFINKTKAKGLVESEINQIIKIIKPRIHIADSDLTKNNFFQAVTYKIINQLFENRLIAIGITDQEQIKNIIEKRKNLEDEVKQDEQLNELNNEFNILGIEEKAEDLLHDIVIETEDYIRASKAASNGEDFVAFNKEYRNDLFHLLNNKIIVPLLTDLFQELVKQQTKLTDENVECLFGLIGALRHKVAAEVQDTDAGLMGNMNGGSGIADPVSSNSRWKSWKEAEEKFIKELYKTPNNKISFKLENGKGEFSAQNSVRYKFDYEITADNEIKSNDIYCFHQNKTEDQCQRIFKHIQLILDFDTNNSKADLENLLGSLFWEANQVSIYGRGQASISEMLIKSLSVVKGYNIEWNLKDTGMNLDQWALYLIEKGKFIEFFKQKVNCQLIIANLGDDFSETITKEYSADDYNNNANNDDEYKIKVTGDTEIKLDHI